VKAIALLIRRGLQQHALSSLLAALLVALATGGLLTVWTVRTAAREAFADAAGPFDAVLGARGSPLQLVMAGLLHLEPAQGRLPANEAVNLKHHPAVAAATPIAIGDSYKGWRIVGVSSDFFSPEIWGSLKAPELRSGGQWFADDGHQLVVGSHAAAQLGLKPGDHLHPEHGLDYSKEASEDHEHDEEFIVSGVLKPTGTPMDRVLWVPLQAMQTLSGHDPAAAHSASLILVKFKPNAGAAAFQLAQQMNREAGPYTLAWPVAALIAGLFDRLMWVDHVLSLGAMMAMVMAALCVVVALQGSMSARQRDWAILRAMGAHRSQLLASVAGEAGGIGLCGIILGYAIYATLAGMITWQVQLRTGVILDMTRANPALIIGPVCMCFLCLISGLWPAWQAYRTAVSDKLAARS